MNNPKPESSIIRVLAVCILLLILLSGSASQAWSKPGSETRHVLLLNSYHQGFQWSDQIIEGIKASLDQQKFKINLHIEHMDTKRYPDQDLTTLVQIYTEKYKSLDLDLIISADDNAFTFIKKYRAQLAGTTPLVFCGVNYLTLDKLEGLTNYTGVNETPDFKGTIDLILQIHPAVKRIISITDLTTSGYINKKIINSLESSYSDRVDIIPWDDLSYSELINQLSQLSTGEIVLFTSFFRDRDGKTFEYDEISEDITSAAAVPVYGSWDYNLGHGIVGGQLASGYFQGKTAGSLGVKIINGESTSDLPPYWQSPNRIMFDKNVLDRFHISSARLPSDAIMINHTASFFEGNQTLILSFSIATLFLLSIIFYQVANTRRRIQAEQKLRLSQIRYHDLTELLPQTIFEIDAMGQITYLNQYGLKWSGYTQEEVSTGFPVQNLFHPDDWERLDKNIKDIYQGAPLRGNKYRIINKKGEVISVLGYSRPCQAENGSIGLHGILTDVSALQSAEQDAILTRLYLQNVVDLMPTILIGTDSNGAVNLWNKHTTKVTKIAPQAALGQLLSTILPALAPEQEQVRTALKESKTLSSSRVLRNISDEERYWDIRIYPLSPQDSDRAIIYIDDVTDQIQMERMMIQSEKMMSIGGLAAGMAHEINNPLGAILQSTQVISRRLCSDAPANIRTAEDCDIKFQNLNDYLESRKIPSMIEVILESGSRIANIIQDMLSFSGRDDDSLTGRSAVNIHDLLDHALSFAKKERTNYDFNRIKIKKEYAGIPSVNCTKNQIRQVLLNIIKNGAEAMAAWEQMEEDPEFILRTSQIDNFVRIEIEDNGPGISKKNQKRIFEPFFTTKQQGIGTGLGLSISYFIIVQNHKGTIDLISSPGKGTRFIIDLPIS